MFAEVVTEIIVNLLALANVVVKLGIKGGFIHL
jgi:hypothetical protein